MKLIWMILIGVLIMSNLFSKEIIVTDFTEDSPLKSLGVEKGDLLASYNGSKVNSVEQLSELKQEVTTEEVEITFQRAEQLISVKIPAGTLGLYLREFEEDHIFDNDAKIIEGVGRLDWGIGMENTFFGCLDRIEEFRGSDLSYNDMIGLSTYAFRTHFYPEFCPSSPDATVGFDTGSYLINILGYDFDVYFLDNDTIDKEKHPHFNYLNKEDLIGVIKKSIDNGWPVIATDLIEVPEWGLVTGYQGDELICRTYFDKTRGYEIATKTPWLVYVITDKKDVDLTAAYKNCVRKATEINNQEMFAEYYSGPKAFARWSDDLSNDKLYTALENNELQVRGHANWWIYSTILEARHLLIDFLRQNSDKLDFPKLEVLIELYQEQYTLMDKHYKDFAEPQFGINERVWDQQTRVIQAKVIKDLQLIEEKILNLLNMNI